MRGRGSGAAGTSAGAGSRRRPAGAAAAARPARRARCATGRGAAGPSASPTSRPSRRAARRAGDAAPGRALAAPAGRSRATATDAPAPARLHIRKDDFRYLRLREKTGTTAIFAVDASGSAARRAAGRDQGRGRAAAGRMLCAPRQRGADRLSRQERRDAAGADALADARQAQPVRACRAAAARRWRAASSPRSRWRCGAARKGQSAVAVFLTDGRGNVALDGTSGKDAGRPKTRPSAARLFRGAGVRAILIDTAQRPQARARDAGARSRRRISGAAARRRTGDGARDRHAHGRLSRHGLVARRARPGRVEGRDWPNRAAQPLRLAGGLDWHVQEMGEGPGLLLLHGTGAATHSFRDLAPLLAKRLLAC